MSYIELDILESRKLLDNKFCDTFSKVSKVSKVSKESYFNRFLTPNSKNNVSKNSSNNGKKSIQIKIHNSIYYKYFC